MDSMDFYQDYKNYGEKNYMHPKVGIKSNRNSHCGQNKSIKSVNSIYRQYQGLVNAERNSSNYIQLVFRGRVYWYCGIYGSQKCIR